MPHDHFYGIAAEEIARHEFDKDLMARAYAIALGDAEKTKAVYISIRAERLDELARAKVAADEAERRNEIERTKQKPAAAKPPDNRKPHIIKLSEKFGFLAKMQIPESDIPSTKFFGEKDSLVAPARLSDVAEAIGCLEFKVIDAV